MNPTNRLKSYNPSNPCFKDSPHFIYFSNFIILRDIYISKKNFYKKMSLKNLKTLRNVNKMLRKSPASDA